MTLFVATEGIGEDDAAAPDRKPGPRGVAHAVERGAAQTLCGAPTGPLTDSMEQWPGGQGTFALCPRCEAAVRTSGS